MITIASAEQVERVVAACRAAREILTSQSPTGYPDSLALCIVDSVQSTGVKYRSVCGVIRRYRGFRSAAGGDADTDGADDLLATFVELGGAEGWAARIGNRNRTSTRAGAPLKAEAIRCEATTMVECGIRTTADLNAAADDADRLETVRQAWQAVVGQSSGITWRYLLMLAGRPGVKPDRMIKRFVANAVDIEEVSMTTPFAVDAVLKAAGKLAISPTDLDHGIWQWQRRQPRRKRRVAGNAER